MKMTTVGEHWPEPRDKVPALTPVFKRTADGRPLNITKASAEYRRDPVIARAAAKAAGWTDAEFNRWFDPKNPR